IPFTNAPVQLYHMDNRTSMNKSGFTELIEDITKKHE
ncbi:LysR family transcriptional regulator, partial [Salmonella enterica subsp. enterica serovar Schwarzengrund]